MRANEFTKQYIEEGDNFDIELSQDLCLSTYVKECVEDGVIIEADTKILELLEQHGLLEEVGSHVIESSNNPSAEDSTSPIHGDDELDEAEYRGRKVALGKPMKGDVKKSKVYVKGPKGNVVKVNFGDPNMRIKKSSPKHRKSFRARHHCENPGPRWKARYWSCRAW